MISVPFQGKPFNITVMQVYALTSNAEAEWFYEDLQDLLELTPQKGGALLAKGSFICNFLSRTKIRVQDSDSLKSDETIK